ncbi:MAG: hypothetical protein HY064_15070 [Bacteroidetes bacterium]|nr:hypothetical protein [Bacteroidota bacterium]
MKLFFITILLLFAIFLVQCGENNVDQIPIVNDTVKPIEKITKNKPDTFQIIDILVNGIKENISTGKLSRKDEAQMDPVGGLVYGYFYSHDSIANLFSSYGGEAGRDETQSYFRNGKLLFSEYSFYWFTLDKNMNKTGETLTAKKIFYLPHSPCAKDSILYFNDSIKGFYPGMKFHRSEFPSDSAITDRIEKMRVNLVKWTK